LFISKVDRNPQSAAMIRAVIALSRRLDLPVIAEGVETEAQREFLAQEIMRPNAGLSGRTAAPDRRICGFGRSPRGQATKRGRGGLESIAA
jgi:predicted signal transduction protein with EAL and GGDEF domain